MFYRVNRVGENHGLDLLKIRPLLTEGRMIRWRSSGAEYGLIEAMVVKFGDPMRVCSASNFRVGEIYIEQVAEVKLTKEEAKANNFGWPE